MRKYLIALVLLSGLSCLPIYIKIWPVTTAPLSSQAADATVRNRMTVRASHDHSAVNLSNGVEWSAAYTGTVESQQTFKKGLVQPCALDAADFDEDGVPDLIVGYSRASGGNLSLQRGNIDSLYANSPEAQRRKASGEFDEAAFLSPARLFELAEAPDFLAAGDFDADGHWDVVTAARGSKSLYLLSGDGRGNLAAARQITLPGTVTALVSGEINRADGLADLIVAVVADDGPKAMVFEGPEGALRANPEVFSLPAAAKALALGRFDDDYLLDLAVATGRELMIVQGRDRRLSLDERRQAEVLPATINHRVFAFDISALAVGDFTATHQTSLALLATDGTVYMVSGKAALNGGLKTSKKSKDKVSDAQAIGQWPGASQLLTARVSVGPADDLLVLDKASHQLRILAGVNSDATTSAAPLTLRATAALDTESEPMAALPMRLNADALNDLVILQSGHLAPAIVKTLAAMTFTVNKADDHDDGVCDSGDCTLREAINAANANPGADTIAFNISGQGAHTIAPTSGLPAITDPVTIDGTTQPGFAGSPIIEITGINDKDGGRINVTAGSTTLRGLVINRFSGAGIILSNNGGNRVEGNFIGTDVTGTMSLFNGIGVNIFRSPNNLIGGTVAAARNVISGNAGNGLQIADDESFGNAIQGNYIGTNAAGTARLGNVNFAGVVLGGVNNIAGGTAAGAGNVISGNSSAGVELGGRGTIVQGNLIGTNAAGTAAIPNSEAGLTLTPAQGVTIGGTTPAARNVISGNTSSGIKMREGNARENLVQGNLIGTAIDGISPLPNLGAAGNSRGGIFIAFGSDNQIGGTASGAGNVIAFNGEAGVIVIGVPGFDAGLRNAIRHNSIFSNDGPGIDLGVTANDACDADTGANNGQNFPVLTNAMSNGFSTTLQGTLNSTANVTFTLEFFANNTCDPSGFGEGQTFIGSTTVTTGSDCNISFNITLLAITHAGQVITATATDPAGNTSQFSPCKAVAEVNPFDLCLQDESNGNFLLVNLTTGNYLFSTCRGLTLTGTGSITRKGCLVTLQVNGPDRRILARIDTCLKNGTASVQSSSQGTTFTIMDKNTANNSCTCPAGQAGSN